MFNKVDVAYAQCVRKPLNGFAFNARLKARKPQSVKFPKLQKQKSAPGAERGTEVSKERQTHAARCSAYRPVNSRVSRPSVRAACLAADWTVALSRPLACQDKGRSRAGAAEGGDGDAFATLKRFSQTKANRIKRWRRKWRTKRS